MAKELSTIEHQKSSTEIIKVIFATYADPDPDQFDLAGFIGKIAGFIGKNL